jgi:hypothetical protein
MMTACAVINIETISSSRIRVVQRRSANEIRTLEAMREDQPRASSRMLGMDDSKMRTCFINESRFRLDATPAHHNE